MKTFVFDLDGVLVNSAHRNSMIMYGPEAYYAELPNDRPYEVMKKILIKLEPDYEIVLLTGRGELRREATEEWLNKNQIPFDKLIMRPNDWYDEVAIYKTRALMELITKGAIIEGYFEDNPLTVEATRSAGIATVHVESGYYNEHDARELQVW